MEGAECDGEKSRREREWSSEQGVAHLNKVVLLGLTEKVTFEIMNAKCLAQCLAQSKRSKM